MPLAPGTQLGPYEITAALGAGGMGEVYRARDTRLERTVAIKILPSHLSSNPDLKLRFEREAKSISALNHPHICVLHDVGSQNGVDFLVMEYVEGETLAARLAKGPLPLEQAVKIGVEIADALDKAHRAGITHRDLKPGNVMLTKSGAKLMDFGLAKASGGIGGAQGAAPLLSAAVTLTSPSPQVSPITSAGAIVGTIQYMSPEQIEGKEADARSDIFALGAVLYEMATGKRAFEGKSQLSVATAILERDPEPVSALLPAAPPALDRAIRTCLAKDPDERFQAAQDLRLELRWIAEGSATAAAQPAVRVPMTRHKVIWAACAVAAIVAAALGGYYAAPTQNMRTLHALIEPPEGLTFDAIGDYGGPFELSPEGDKVVFAAHGSNSPKALWVRSLESPSAQRLEGTEGGYGPFWSPDGRFVGFFANGKLNRIPARGGPVTAVTDAVNARGGSWGTGDVLLFTPDIQAPIFAVSANGGKANPVTKLDTSKHTTHRWPSFLPDGQHFLYLATNHNGGRSEENGIYYASLDGKENRLLVGTDGNAEYASGYLLFHSGIALMAQPFNLNSGKLTGEAVPVVGRIRQDTGVWHTLFAVSQDGLLVYQPSSAQTVGSQLAWLDRSGKQLGQVGERGPYMDPRLSPDGKRVAVSYGDPQREIWIFDLERGTKMRLTFTQGVNTFQNKIQPAWSPDGKIVAFTARVPSSGGGKTAVFAKSASGSGSEKMLVGSEVVSEGGQYGSWSPDGQYFAYTFHHGAKFSLYARPLTGNAAPFEVVAPASPESNIGDYRISPNGRWVAYTSDESGRAEVYIAPFPRGEGKWQVSTSGGDFASWRGDGKEVFYEDNRGGYLSCSITERGNELEIGTPQRLFIANPSALGVDYDVSADGKRFLVNLAGDEAPAPLHVVANWTAELKKK